jgi:hypothetical protein
MIQSFGRGGVNPPILLQGMGQPIPMSASEILAWLEDYDFDAMGLGFAWDDADDEADKAGAVGTLTFSGPIGYSSFRSR